MNQIEFEKRVIEKILMGDDPVLDCLRHQYKNAIVESRKFTGAGFYTYFKIIQETEPVTPRKTFQISDVLASLKGMKAALGFNLLVKEGYIAWLEGYTLSSDIWPDDYFEVKLYYFDADNNRNMEKLKAVWS